jgi:hypothetical protein
VLVERYEAQNYLGNRLFFPERNKTMSGAHGGDHYSRSRRNVGDLGSGAGGTVAEAKGLHFE